MAYTITLPLPQGWSTERETYTDPSGAEISHLEAFLPNDKAGSDEALIDIYVGPMPDDTNAADEALANYVDIVGFDDDDPEDFDPIIEWPFNGRKAYGFEAWCEDDSPMRVMSVEVKKGVLCIMNIVAKDDDKLIETVKLVESKLRIG